MYCYFIQNNVEEMMSDAVKANTSGSDNMRSGAISATKNVENIVLTLARNTLKVGQSATVNTSGARKLSCCTNQTNSYRNYKKYTRSLCTSARVLGQAR